MVNPFSVSHRGTFSADGVRVRRRHRRHRHGNCRSDLCTTRFCTTRTGDLLDVVHDISPNELNDDLAELLAEQLDDAGALSGQREFELVFTGVVLSTIDGTMASWHRFYRNSMDRLERGAAAFAPIHEHAETLLAGTCLLDLGSCFGFFPLRAAARGYRVLATDLSAPTMQLLERVSRELGRPMRTLACDASRVPLADRSVDTVSVLHLLEHLDPETAAAVVGEGLRLARRRVIVAVPFEDEPRACYGHIQRFDTGTLHRLGTRFTDQHEGIHATVHEYHGGWLVIDRSDQTALARGVYGLGPSGHFKLAHDVADMELRGGRRDVELLADLVVGQACCQ